MRQTISTAVVAVVVGAVAGATMGAVAQPGPEAAAPQAIVPTVTSINAHKVDGRHAVSASASRKKRAGKLVATNKQGYLPNNIIKPAWTLMEGKPAGFADNVDNEGVTKVKVKRVESAALNIPHGSVDGLYAYCPPGFVVIGGGGNASWYAHVIDSYSDSNGWFVRYENNSGQPVAVQAVAHCLSVEPAARLSPAGKRK